MLIVQNVLHAIISSMVLTLTATFDVQNAVVESVYDNMISLCVEFLENSSAIGSFVVLGDHFSTEDTFVVLKQNAMNSTILYQSISVSASNYTVYFYDLEDNAIPNVHPAFSTLQVVSVNGSSKYVCSSSICTVISLYSLPILKGLNLLIIMKQEVAF